MSSRNILLSSIGSFKEVQVFDHERPNDLLIKTFEDSEALKEHASILSDVKPGKDFRHVAIIPLSVLDRSMREGWLNDKDKWKQWANDGANANLRTWKGRI